MSLQPLLMFLNVFHTIYNSFPMSCKSILWSKIIKPPMLTTLTCFCIYKLRYSKAKSGWLGGWKSPGAPAVLIKNICSYLGALCAAYGFVPTTTHCSLALVIYPCTVSITPACTMSLQPRGNDDLKNGITDACWTADCCLLLTICPRWCPRYAPDDIIIHCGYYRLPQDGAVIGTFEHCSVCSD